MLPVTNLQRLPPALQVDVSHSLHRFLAEDRGHVRRNNDRTFNTRCDFFRSWITARGLTEHNLRQYDDELLKVIMAHYLQTLKDGNTYKNTPILGTTLSGYLQAAKAELELIVGRTMPYKQGPNWIPLFHEIIQSHKRFEKKQDRKEPIPEEIFTWLHTTLASGGKTDFLGIQAAVYDWLRLGIFTGSRISEYAQSKLAKGQRFQIVPPMSNAPSHYRGKPLAFIRTDFEFYNAQQEKLPYDNIQRRFEQGEIVYLRILYRYDKSSNNFTYRKYTRTHHTIFDPVHAAVDIIERANLLQVNDEEPLGVAIAHNGGYRFLRDSDITRVLRHACVQAFPNEQHYLRQHIKRLVPHSNRVTAAVCMKQGGARDDEIAFRLRWHESSVPTYLRDCFQAVGQALRTTLNGALLQIT